MKVESIFFLFPGCKNLDSCCNTEFKGTDSLSETSSSGVREVFSASVFSFQPLSKSETLSALWLSFCHSITQREYFEKMQHQKTPKILCCVFYWQNRLLLCWSLVAGAVENRRLCLQMKLGRTHCRKPPCYECLWCEMFACDSVREMLLECLRR